MTPNEQAPVEHQLDEGRRTHVGGSAAQSSPGRRQERALDGPFVDLITDGVPGLGATYGAEYDRLIWHALNSTALAAMQAGYDYARWTYLLDESISRLGHQARRAAGRKERSALAYHQLLTKVWTKAEEYMKVNPLPTADEVTTHITAARDTAADADTPINPNQRAVLTAACDLADKHGTTRPALPLHELMARTGLTHKAVRHALAGLAATGLLTRERAGDIRRRRAALYRLQPTTPRAGARTPPKTGLRAPATQGYVPLAVPQPRTPQEDPVTLDELQKAHQIIEEIKRQLRAELRAELGLTDPEPADLPTNVRRLPRRSNP